MRTESMIQTSAQSILAQAMEAETPVAALRYRQLRSKTPQPLQAEAAAEVGDISSTRRAALARANELRAARMAEEKVLQKTLRARPSIRMGPNRRAQKCKRANWRSGKRRNRFLQASSRQRRLSRRRRR